MTIIVSVGYKIKANSGVSFGEMFDGGVIELFDGTKPGPNAAPTGTKIARITYNGGGYTHGNPTNGLIYSVGSDGSIVQPPGANWVVTGLAAGTATWARMIGYTDTLLDSYVDPRIDFDVNPTDGSATGIFMANAAPGVSNQFPVTFFLFGIPPFS